MALPLPNLDDRRWADLVEEGRTLIPLYSPEWTDHNIHDPGITFMELFAWIAEMDLYQVNRIPDAHRHKFLALVNVTPSPPKGARVSLGFQTNGTNAIYLPESTQIETHDPQGNPVLFSLLNELNVMPAKLVVIQSYHEHVFSDLSAALHRGESIYPLGKDPKLGSAMYLGLDLSAANLNSEPLSFYVDVKGNGDSARQALLQRRAAQWLACHPEHTWCCDHQSADPHVTQAPLLHHAVRLQWDVYMGNGQWYTLEPEAVIDETRVFTLSGQVTLKLPVTPALGRFGEVDTQLAYLRCRVARGQYDAAPRVNSLLINAALAEQAVPVSGINWTIAPGAPVTGNSPVAGDWARFALTFDSQQRIASLAFGVTTAPAFRVLAYQAPGLSAPGYLVVTAQTVGIGNGKPHQTFRLAQAAVANQSLRIVSLESSDWQEWSQQADFDYSQPMDAHYTLAPQKAIIRFGDGAQGRVVPSGVTLLASYRATRAEQGNLTQQLDWRLADNPHNRAVLPDFDTLQNALHSIVNELPPSGGANAESLDNVMARAFEQVNRVGRAVTLTDYEQLAQQTPGVHLARVAARANLQPDFPCLQATGVVTLTVLPYLPQQQPTPCRELRQAMAAYLAERRILGSRIEVVGPTYIEVIVHATVQACAGVDAQQLQQRISTALNDFFHPITGGPDRDGWPFGRDIYRSEVMQVIDETQGSDYVTSLELVSRGKARCGNLCLPPNGLVAAGEHHITILRATS